MLPRTGKNGEHVIKENSESHLQRLSQFTTNYTSTMWDRQNFVKDNLINGILHVHIPVWVALATSVPVSALKSAPVTLKLVSLLAVCVSYKVFWMK